MIIYRVTVEVNNDIEIDWLKWMKEIHIPDVIKTGYFFDWKIEKQILPDNSLDKTIYIINYYTNTISIIRSILKEMPPDYKKNITKNILVNFKLLVSF